MASSSSVTSVGASVGYVFLTPQEELKEEGEDEDLSYEYVNDDEDIEDLEDFEYEEDWEEDKK